MASHTVDPVHYPTDREFEKLGYDIESSVPDTGKLRFIEVKGRVSGASTVTFTRNEILYSLNKPEDFILGIVEFLDDGAHRVHHVREPFKREPDFGVTSVNTDSLGNLAPFAVAGDTSASTCRPCLPPTVFRNPDGASRTAETRISVTMTHDGPLCGRRAEHSRRESRASGAG